MDLIEDRYRKGVHIISSQVDMMGWKTLFEDPVVADALVDRLTEPKRDHPPNGRLVPCQALKTKSQ